MSQDEHARVKEIFLKASELKGTKRKEFIEKACGNNDKLRDSVISLLENDNPETILTGLSESLVDSEKRKERLKSHDWVGQRLGNYEIERVIYAGGMGIVFEAVDTVIERRVAIKVLHEDLTKDESLRTRFVSEARAVGRLNHPHVLTIHEVGSNEGVDYLVMEYATGGSAADHLKNVGVYSPGEATRILEQACGGLSAAHKEGLIHRDIKPANLLFIEGDITKVSDFGVAKFTHGESLELTRQGQLVGTPCYMSPEQCEGKSVDERSDVYSLGATYFSLLVGRMPYEEENSFVSVMHAHCNAEPPDPREWSDRIPEPCAEIILKAMAKKPEDRYQTVEEMQHALVLLLSELTMPAGLSADTSFTLNPEIKMLPRRDIRKRIAGLAIGLLVLIGLVLFLIIRVETGPEDNQAIVPPVEQEPIRIGILHSLTGAMATSEEVIVDSYKLAIKEINDNGGVLGRKIEPIIRDGKSNDVVFAQQATELITEEGVCTIFGCCTSGSRKAVQEVVEENNHLLVYSVNTEGVEISPNIIYLGGDPNQTVLPFVKWAYAFEEKRTFFLVGSDYIFPHVVNDIVKDQLDSLGAELVGEEYLDFDAADVTNVLDKIEATQPDAIINTITGDSQMLFLRGLEKRKIETTQFATGIGEDVLRRVNYNPSIKNYSCTTYFQSLKNKENEIFVDDFQEMFGEFRVLISSMEAGYDGVYLWARAVEKSGSLDPIKIRDAMSGMEMQAPSGKVSIDPKTQYSVRNGFIGLANSYDQYEIVWRSPEPIEPDPYPAMRTKEEWQEYLDGLYQSWGNNWTAPEK
ncbi:Serine/threonine-protein kinase PrkC [Polystyrenella longa]|uniref:non-specific serine/threonine protein kinase n=1 Tax=Polystyrenella longa TaxID=2528007 RepID=A0A518CP47_9PLAN|nr:bifunctional serine/threonine-protein kinase/ABC transporter substrate-binding protein [Polystyrenella longa]QDU80995.1 Serine/threonine-protein kinase PrkC [Polystyrenella longa]